MLSKLAPQWHDPKAFAALFDHTLLKPDAQVSQIRTLCDEALAHGFKGVCVNPCYVGTAARLLGHSPLRTMAVIGFPLGANRTDIKIDETLRAVADGANELDMVINLGLYLSGETTSVRHDISSVVRAAAKVPVKVILETAYLSVAQIEELTQWVMDAGAAFVKTSTGFAARGASTSDVEAMARVAKGRLGIKASGGVRTLSDAISFLEAGATRLGASASVSILQEFLKHADPSRGLS